MLRPFLSIAAALIVPAAALSQQSGHAESLAPYEEAARQLARAVNTGNGGYLDRAFDYDRFFGAVVADIDADSSFREQFVAGARSSFALGPMLARGVEAGGSYTMLRVRPVDGNVHALFRFISDEGLNYHDVHLVQTPNGVRIADMHIIATGETLTTTIRRLYRHAALQTAPESQEILQAARVATQMRHLIAAGQPAKALELWETLTPAARQEKLVQVMRVAAAVHLGDSIHAEALADYARNFQGDVTADLLSVDALLMEEKWEEMLAALDRVDAAIGGDPYLDVLRASAMIASGDLARARAFAESAVRREPESFQTKDALLSVSIADGGFADVVRMLEAMESEHGLAFDSIRGDPLFATFLRSPEYREWRAQKAQPKQERVVAPKRRPG